MNDVVSSRHTLDGARPHFEMNRVPVDRGEQLGIAQVFEPGTDGAFRVVELLVRKLIERGHSVSIAYSDRRPSPALFELLKHVHEAGGASLNLRVHNGPEPVDALAWLRLSRWLSQIRPHVIHAHSSKAGVLARTAWVPGPRPRVFYTPHAYYGLSRRQGLKAGFFNSVERHLGGVGRSLMTSREEMRFAREHLGIAERDLSLVQNCVDTKRFFPENAQKERNELGIPRDAVVLGAVGRMSFQKDPQTLYRAFSRCARKIPNLHLLHIGEGELEGELKELAAELRIEDRISRHGYFDDTAPIYRVMDGLIMTSRYEGLSMVSLEALATNLPLILSEVPGTSDLDPGSLSHCWTAAVGDVEGFAAAIESWYRVTLDKAPCNHRTQAVERFSVDQWVDRHIELYRRA